MKNNFQARKIRQLKYRIKLLKNYTVSSEKSAELQKLISKIKGLIHELKYGISRNRIRKIVGSAAILLGLGLGPTAHAQQFGERIVNPFGIIPVTDTSIPPTLCDLDGDGDFDLLVGNYAGGIAYHENIGSTTVPSFASGLLNQFGLPFREDFIPLFGDLDNDGDLDLLGLDGGEGFEYYENIGTITSPSFSENPEVNPFNLIETYLSLAQLADLDNDGDLDIIGHEDEGTIVFWENNGSPESPNFELATDAFGLTAPVYLSAEFSDIDQDGDLDMLGIDVLNFDSGASNFYFQRNNGDAENPAFGQLVSDPFGLTGILNHFYTFPTMADLDGDGDEDLLVSTNIYGQDTLEFSYYELLSTVQTENIISNSSTTIFPNPTSDILTIETDMDIVSFEIFDIVGQQVISDNFNGNTINVNPLEKGVYILKLKNDKNEIVVKKFNKI